MRKGNAIRAEWNFAKKFDDKIIIMMYNIKQISISKISKYFLRGDIHETVSVVLR